MWKAAKNKLKNVSNNTVLYSFVINLLFFVFCLVFAGIRFETNDDNGMSQIGYGVYGQYSEYLVFVNVLVGFVNKALLLLFPQIPWYLVLMLVIMFFSYWIMSYVMLETNNNVVCVIILLAFIGCNTYSNVQFTKVAGVATVAGISLLYLYLINEKHRFIDVVIATGLLLVGASYRFEMFCACVALMSGLLIGYVVKKYKEGELKKKTKYILIAFVPFALSLLAYFANGIYASTDSEYEYYTEFNKNRAELTDYGWPEYSKNESVYTELGITEDDLLMFEHWNFADPDVFNLEAAKKLVSVKVPTSKRQAVKEFIKWYPKDLLQYRWIIGVIFIAIVSVLCAPKKWYLYLYSIFVLSVFELYLTYRQRYLMERVDVVVFLALYVVFALLMLEHIGNISEKLDVRRCAFVSLFSIVCMVQTIYSQTMDMEKTSNKDGCIEIVNSISEDKSHLYIFSTQDAWFLNALYGATDVPPKGIASNMYILGGWGTYLPATNDVKHNYNIDNPYKDIVNRDDVYVVYSCIEEYLGYVRRHYDPSVYAVVMKKIGDKNCYCIRNDEYVLPEITEKENPEELYIEMNDYLDKNEYVVDGYVYMEGMDSNSGVCVAELERRNGSFEYINLQQYEDNKFDSPDKLYSRYRFSIDKPNRYIHCKVFYCFGGKKYEIYDRKID